jgi:signal transduction histidine kinase
MTHKSLFDSATLRLTAWYMVILMSISLLFSVLLYRVASDELDRAFGPRGGNVRVFVNDDEVVDMRAQMIHDSNERLMTNLLLFNVVVLVGGSAVSYALARRTLQPIEAALESQSRFSSDAAHELKTPLAVMQSEIEVGLRNTAATKKSHQELLESSLDEVHRMRMLTDRLLLLANNQSIETAPVDIETVGVEALNRSIPLAISKHIKIENNISSARAMGDAESITDVLTILIDNAIKYSPEKSTIHLEQRVADKTVQIHVRDEGIGIEPHDIEHVFDRFYRADTSRSKLNVPGYGLGLSIAQRLMSLQQGSITIKSAKGKGSTFTITLPKA